MHACCRRLSRFYQSLPISKRMKTPPNPLPVLHDVTPTPSPLENITFSFSEKISIRTNSGSSASSYRTASDCSRGSDNSVFQTPPAPKLFMDSSGHSEDLHFLSSSREADRTSLSSTASSTGYPRRPDSGGAPFYMPMNNVKGGRSPGSNSKVSVSLLFIIYCLVMVLICFDVTDNPLVLFVLAHSSEKTTSSEPFWITDSFTSNVYVNRWR